MILKKTKGISFRIGEKVYAIEKVSTSKKTVDVLVTDTSNEDPSNLIEQPESTTMTFNEFDTLALGAEEIIESEASYTANDTPIEVGTTITWSNKTKSRVTKCERAANDFKITFENQPTKGQLTEGTISFQDLSVLVNSGMAFLS